MTTLCGAQHPTEAVTCRMHPGHLGSHRVLLEWTEAAPEQTPAALTAQGFTRLIANLTDPEIAAVIAARRQAKHETHNLVDLQARRVGMGTIGSGWAAARLIALNAANRRLADAAIDHLNRLLFGRACEETAMAIELRELIAPAAYAALTGSFQSILPQLDSKEKAA